MIRTLTDPLFRRVGTFVAGYAASIGATAEQQAQITLGVVAGLAIAGDVLLSRFHQIKLLRRATGRGN